ncbi:MAG TPA: hypothetical protein VHP11_15200 [Tepidisphaeraceae bacterium]|nr:hypothetical protein [Tepidisphaeraceae bacterium]
MEAPSAEFPGLQIVWLLVLAIPVACVAWTVTHEEVFREPREYCIQRSQGDPTIWQRKLFYLFTCEYCFSHYVTAFFLFFTGYRLLLDDWRGYVLSFFALVWVANVYMSLFSRLRVDITSERAHAKEKEKVVEKLQAEIDDSKQSSAPATRDQT